MAGSLDIEPLFMRVQRESLLLDIWNDQGCAEDLPPVAAPAARKGR